MDSSERNSAFLFFGRCRSPKQKHQGGLLRTLQYYDKHGMLNIKFLHDWLNTRSPHPLRHDQHDSPKRIYVGGAEPDAEPKRNKADIYLSMFSTPSKIFPRINEELVSYASRSKSLSDFLERVSLHRNDLFS